MNSFKMIQTALSSTGAYRYIRYIPALGSYRLNKFNVTTKSKFSEPTSPVLPSAYFFLPVRGITAESSRTALQCKSRPPVARAVIYCLKHRRNL